MIRYVKLRNFKSLVKLDVDFMKTKTKAKDIILIYGENGVGKSNFAKSFYTLGETMRTMNSIESWKKLLEKIPSDANSEKIKNYMNFLESNIKDNYKDTQMIIKDCKTIDSTENMVLEYGFNIKGKNGVYHIEMNDDEIVSEKLEYVLNKNQTFFIDINKNNVKLNENIFIDNKYFIEFKDLLDKYWGKHSFMSILTYEIQDKKNGYVKTKISKSLFDALTYLSSICSKINCGNHTEFAVIGTQHDILNELQNGIIGIKKEEQLIKAENMMNIFFTSLYSDIKQVYYKKDYTETKIKYKLYVKKLVYGKLIDVNFDFESTGTQNLLEILPYLICAYEGQTVVIDEMDKGIHDLMVYNILSDMLDAIKGQLIITTHNTLLIESDIDKSKIYVFNVNRDSTKELIPITEYTGRVHKNLNPRKKYLNGMYGGVPIMSDIDFNDLINNLK